jgi:hypothetical protein
VAQPLVTLQKPNAQERSDQACVFHRLSAERLQPGESGKIVTAHIKLASVAFSVVPSAAKAGGSGVTAVIFLLKLGCRTALRFPSSGVHQSWLTEPQGQTRESAWRCVSCGICTCFDLVSCKVSVPSRCVVREVVTSSKRNERSPRKRAAGGRGLALLEVLDRLAAGASLGEVMAATGLSDSELRVCFQNAAERIRRSKAKKPGNDVILDWRDVSLAEALHIIADHAIKKKP